MPHLSDRGYSNQGTGELSSDFRKSRILLGNCGHPDPCAASGPEIGRNSVKRRIAESTTRRDPHCRQRLTMSATSGDSEDSAATRRSAASAFARRPASSTRQLRNAESRRAAT